MKKDSPRNAEWFSVIFNWLLMKWHGYCSVPPFGQSFSKNREVMLRERWFHGKVIVTSWGIESVLVARECGGFPIPSFPNYMLHNQSALSVATVGGGRGDKSACLAEQRQGKGNYENSSDGIKLFSFFINFWVSSLTLCMFHFHSLTTCHLKAWSEIKAPESNFIISDHILQRQSLNCALTYRFTEKTSWGCNIIKSTLQRCFPGTQQLFLQGRDITTTQQIHNRSVKHLTSFETDDFMSFCSSNFSIFLHILLYKAPKQFHFRKALYFLLSACNFLRKSKTLTVQTDESVEIYSASPQIFT